jgi:hypothetical protein
VQGQAGRPGKTALTYESYPHNSTDFAPSTRGVRDLFRNPIWKLFRLSRISHWGLFRLSCISLHIQCEVALMSGDVHFCSNWPRWMLFALKCCAAEPSLTDT